MYVCMARAFLPVCDNRVRCSRSNAGTDHVQTHYTRSVLSIDGTKGASGFLVIMLQENWREGCRGGATFTPIGAFWVNVRSYGLAT